MFAMQYVAMCICCMYLCYGDQVTHVTVLCRHMYYVDHMYVTMDIYCSIINITIHAL